MERSWHSFALGAIQPCGSPDGASELRAEVPLRGSDPGVAVTVRFAQAVERRLLDAEGNPVGELLIAGRRYLPGEEAIEHEVRLDSLPNRTAEIRTAGSERAELTENGALAGALLWCWEPLHGTVEAWTEEVEPDLHLVRVEIANRMEWDGSAPERYPMRTLRATEVELHSPHGALVPLAAAAA